jgi:hypothetical protein
MRAVIQAVVLDGLTAKEAAQLLHVPVSTVKTRHPVRRCDIGYVPGTWTCRCARASETLRKGEGRGGVSPDKPDRQGT